MKNVKRIVSILMVVAIIASLGAVGFASNRFKTDVVSDWQYGMLNDLSSGNRTLGQEPALTVTPASDQAKQTQTVVVQENVLDSAPTKEAAVTTKAPVTTTTTKVPATKATVSSNPYVNEWQQAILDDLSTGQRHVGQTETITVYKDAQTALNPGTTSYDYIAWH